MPAFVKPWRSGSVTEWSRMAIKNTPTISGRYMLTNAQEYACRVRCITINSAEILTGTTGASGDIGDWVILYFDNIGIVIVCINKLTSGGFIAMLQINADRRDSIKARIQWIIGEYFAKIEVRDSARVVPTEINTFIHLSSDRSYPGTIADLSLSGVAIRSEAADRVVLGESIRIGKTKATVVRRFDGGFAAQFEIPFSPEKFLPDIRL
jgi:hypothetical protein